METKEHVTLQELSDLVYDGFRELRERSKELDKRFRETADRIRETDREIDKTRKMVAGISDSLGLFAENMVAPSIIKLFQERGIDLDRYYSRAKSRKVEGRRIEIDVIATNDDYAVAIEVKTRLKVDDIRDFVEKLRYFRSYYPEYEEKIIYGAIAGMSIEEEADVYAERMGLFVLGQSGENIKIYNSKDFTPKEF